MTNGKPGPVDVLCIYRVTKGKEAEFEKLLARHGPALHKAGLTAGEAPRIWRSESRDGKTVFIEMMRWKDESSSDAAHRIPDLMAIWEPMRKLTDGMELLHLQPAGVGTA
jgi:hypothetical protein